MDLLPNSFTASKSAADLRRGDQLIRYNRTKTQEGYAAMVSGGADDCSCSYCRKFIAQRQTTYPASFPLLLDQLGIDPAKEGEIYECGDAGDGRRLYGGWLFFCGEIVEKREGRVDDAEIQYWIAEGRTLPPPTGDFGLDLLALDFTMKLPWILDQQP